MAAALMSSHGASDTFVLTAASRVDVLPSTIEDVYALAAKLRADDRAEVDSLGLDPRSALRLSFRQAVLRKTYFVDGEIAAMSGLCGSMLGDIGHPYLMTGPAVERVPLAMVRYARLAATEMLQHKLLLEGHVAASYIRACRFLELVGFTVGEPQSVGPRKAMFRRFSLSRAG